MHARLAIAVALALLVSGCATLTGTICGATGEWPTTSSLDNKQWIDGEPVTTLTVEARLESPPRAICETHRYEPAAHVTHDAWGFDTIGRISYGFVGLSELAIGAALAFIEDPEGGVGPGRQVAGAVVGLDGIATLVLAFLIPDSHRHWEEEVPPQQVVSGQCPSNVAFEAAGHAFGVAPDGTLSALDGRSLMLAVVETGKPIALRFGSETRWTTVPPDVRCGWALELGSAFAPAVCPRPPPMPVAFPR